jgi:hypothetical protein
MLPVAVFLSCLFGAEFAFAGPVFFNVIGASFTPGSGYGVDAGENSKDNPTLLDVRFSTSGFSALNFTLSLPSPDSQSFLFGSIDVQEPNTGGGILAAETDNLDVTATFTFIDPLGTMQNLVAVGSAVVGSVSDSHIDYTLTWEPPILVPFGDGGLFQIALETLTFTSMGPQNLYATISLLSEVTPPDPGPGPQPIPEPSAIALLGTGIALTRLVVGRRQPAKDRA